MFNAFFKNASLQMQVQARDQRFPQERFATAPVTIFVTRTRNPPIFVQTPYDTVISENTLAGTSVYRVTAQDSDLEVIYSELIC